MLKNTIEKLIDKQDLTSTETQKAIEEILSDANPHQTAAFLVLMRAKGETPDEIAGIIQAMDHFMVPVQVDTPVLDIVGTGGDGARTINISTGAALLAASCGVKIAKHGNRSFSSLCGSADVLEALGIDIQLSPEKVKQSIETHGIGFMFAPLFHPALKNFAAVRKGLNVRTAFNLIGPLLNPARAPYRMIGVCDERLLELMAKALFKLGTKRAFVFHGNGLDELSCVGPAKVIEVTPTGMHAFTLDPQQLGLPLCTIEDLRGGTAAENAQILRDVFAGKEGPIANTLVLNAAVALYLYGTVPSIEAGIAHASQNLKNGAALKLLENWAC